MKEALNIIPHLSFLMADEQFNFLLRVKITSISLYIHIVTKTIQVITQKSVQKQVTVHIYQNRPRLQIRSRSET